MRLLETLRGWRLPALLVAIKLVVLLLDDSVRLYLGDSAAYLAGVQDRRWLPTDRSFTYSLFLAACVRPFGRLQAVLIWQGLAGVVVAWLLWHVLTRRLGTRHGVGAAAACLFALDPAQLYLERMVLAETLGLLAFVGMFASGCHYLSSRQAIWLPVVAGLGVAAVSFRMNYLPVVLVVSVCLPLLLLAVNGRPAVRVVVRHLVVAVVCVGAVHTGYRQWVAVTFGVTPTYLPRSGFMQMGLVAPLITPAHLERAGLPRDFERRLQYPLADRGARMAHMWAPGGLTQTLRAHGADVEATARSLSRMALTDNPLGLVPLGLATAGDYFRSASRQHGLDNDLGRRDIPPDLLRTLRDQWRYDATGLPTRVTMISAYYEHTWWWLVACLVLLVPLGAVNVAVHWHSAYRAQVLLAAAVGTGLVLSHLLFVNVALFRYLHPLPFFVLVNGFGAVWRPSRGLTFRVSAGRRGSARRPPSPGT